MIRTPLLAAALLGFPLLLSACNSEPETVNSGPADPDAAAVAAAPKVELPPAIKASRTYRCKDNSLIYIAFLADDVTANFRTEQSAPPVVLKAPAAGEPFVAEGYTLTGSGTTVTLAQPDKPAQSCKA